MALSAGRIFLFTALAFSVAATAWPAEKNASGATGPSRTSPSAPAVPSAARPEQAVLDQVRAVYDKRYGSKTLQALESLQRGIKAFTQGQYAQARTELSRLAIAQETALGDYALFYLAASHPDKPETAKRILQKLVDQYPESALRAPAKVDLAGLEKEAGRWQAVVNILNQPAVLDRNSYAMAMLAEGYEKLGQTAAARELYEKIYYEAPASKEAELAAAKLADPAAEKGRELSAAPRVIQRVEGLIKAWKYKDALAALQKLTLQEPPQAIKDAIYLKQGICFYYLKNYPAAIESLRHVSAKKPDHHAEALYYEYQCRRKQKLTDEAATVLQKMQERYPLHKWTAQAFYNQATYFEIKKLPEDAARIYRQLAERFREGESGERAWWKTLWVDFSAGRYERAAQGYLDYVRHFPDGPNNLAALYWAGRAYEKLNNPAVAAQLFREVCARTSNWYGLMAEEALRKLGRRDTTRSATLDIDDIVGKVRLREPNISVPAEQLPSHLEKVRQLRHCKLDSLALKELDVIGGRPPARPDFLKTEWEKEKVDYLRWILAMRQVTPNYYQYHHDELPIEVWKILFPLQNWAKIKEEAGKYNIDPYLMCALIRQESVYDAKSLSSAKAMGLTQILPSTGKMIAHRLGYKKFSPKRLYEPSLNIEFGTYFFSTLLKRYAGNVEAALAAYNGGPTRADAWSQQFGLEDISRMVESIPLNETRNYVKSIVAMRERYKKIYGSKATSDQLAGR